MSCPEAKGERGELNIKMPTVLSLTAYHSVLQEWWQAAVAEAQQLNWGISCVLLWSKLYSGMWVDKLINEFLKTSASLSCPKAFHLSNLPSQRGLKSVMFQIQKHQSTLLMIHYKPKLFLFPFLVFLLGSQKTDKHTLFILKICSYCRPHWFLTV